MLASEIIVASNRAVLGQRSLERDSESGHQAIPILVHSYSLTDAGQTESPLRG